MNFAFFPSDKILNKTSFTATVNKNFFVYCTVRFYNKQQTTIRFGNQNQSSLLRRIEKRQTIHNWYKPVMSNGPFGDQRCVKQQGNLWIIAVNKTHTQQNKIINKSKTKIIQ